MSLLVQFINGKRSALCSLSGLPLRLRPLTEDSSMITVSSCGVKLQEEQWTYTCTFVAFLNIHYFFFLSTCGVTTWGVTSIVVVVLFSLARLA